MSGATEPAATAARRQRARSSISGSVSSVPAAGTSSAMAGVADDMRRTRAAAKRAAMDDTQRVTSTAPTQQAKKRAALANLSNQSNIPASRTVAKAQVIWCKWFAPSPLLTTGGMVARSAIGHWKLEGE